MKSLFVAVLLCAPLCANAATIFASGPFYGGPGGNEAVCYIYNNGPGAVTISGASIYDETGAASFSNTSCGSRLLPNKACFVSSYFPVAGLAHYCALTVSSSAGLHGNVDIRNGTQPAVVYTSQPLR